jgi:hypothetical protein
LFDFFKKKIPPQEPPKGFPPVPPWRPDIVQPLNTLVERIRYYTNGLKDFAIFENGTFAILADGLSDVEAEMAAKDALRKVFHAHPDMNPLTMKDGNVLVRYNHDVGNVVLDAIVQANWLEIERMHQQAIATAEVLITPLGQNVFDDFGKKSLFGRCYMFMDAQNGKVARVERKA